MEKVTGRHHDKPHEEPGGHEQEPIGKQEAARRERGTGGHDARRASRQRSKCSPTTESDLTRDSLTSTSPACRPLQPQQVRVPVLLERGQFLPHERRERLPRVAAASSPRSDTC